MKKLKIILISIFFVGIQIFSVESKYITLELFFQRIDIRGKVLDANTKEPLVGVNILEKGTNNGTVTDNNGNYTISVKSENSVLVYSFLGYDSQEIIVKDKREIDIFMSESQTLLDEVIVVGYGTMKKKDLTGSILSIKEKDLKNIPVNNALELLQGKISGIDMTKSSGEAGSSVNFTIRGYRSITASNMPLVIVDGIPYGSYIDINPNEIKSIEILKDASATSIYGSKGANGVILITTKKGENLKSKLNLNIYSGTNVIAGYPEFTDAYEWIEMRREAYRAINLWHSEADDPAIFGNTYQLIQNKNFVNWHELLIHKGSIKNYHINISGGNEKTLYLLSFDYNFEKGILKNDIYRHYNIRNSVDHAFNSWIKSGINMIYGITNRDRRKNPFNQANKMPPVGTPFDEEGNIIYYPFNDGQAVSPLADEIPGAYFNNQLGKKLFINSYIELHPFKLVLYKSIFGLILNDNRQGLFADRFSLERSAQPSYASVEINNNRMWQWENYITFEKQLKNNFFQIMVGASASKSITENFYEEGQNVFLKKMKIYNLSAVDKSTMNINSYYEQLQTLSFYGRANFNIKDKYLFTITLRKDGSSVLAPGNKWQDFPSIALAWKVHNEKFLKNISFINQFKCRLSYGISGNSSVKPYQTDSRLGQTMYSWGENTPAQGYYLRTMAAEDLDWETTETYNLGLDVNLFNNKFSLTIDRYWQHTFDLLLEKKLPTASGFYSVISNVGETKNNGLEITLSTTNIEKSNIIRWTTDFTFTTNKEKIVKLADSITVDIENGWFVGYPINVFYDYKKIGIWQLEEEVIAKKFGGFMPGEIKVLDYSRDSIFSANDKHIIGNPRPKWIIGINNRFEFKGLDFSFFIFARLGQMIFSEAHSRYDLSVEGVSIKVDYWTPTNPTNAYPRPNRSAPHRELISTLGYVDGSFIKIRDITLGYTLPSKYVKKIKIENFRVYTTLKNYFTWSKLNPYDPERGGSASFPMTKQWIFGFNLNL